MAINKVVYGTETLVDLTDANVTAESLPKGVTAYGRSGVLLTGAAEYVSWDEAKDYVGKNRLPLDGVTKTESGITYTVDADAGTVAVSGTSTGASSFTICQNVPLAAGEYVFSAGTLEADLSATVVIDGTTYTVTKSETKKTISVAADTVITSAAIAYGASGQPLSTVYPMLRLSSTPEGFERHIKSNVELEGLVATAQQTAEQAAQSTADAVKWSQATGYVAKNLLENTATSQTINGVTFTVNDDKSITANGTATAAIQYVLSTNNEIAQGTYTLSGEATGALATCYISIARISKADGSKAQNGAYYNTPIQYVVDNDDYLYEFRLTATQGNVINNLTFYPMLRLASIKDPTYVPYAMSNRELTEKVQDLLIRIAALES